MALSPWTPDGCRHASCRGDVIGRRGGRPAYGWSFITNVTLDRAADLLVASKVLPEQRMATGLSGTVIYGAPTVFLWVVRLSLS